MQPTKKRVFGYYYSPGAKTFHIVVRIKDVPGALNEVLELLRNHVDIIGSISYGLEDGTAIWSGFVRALSERETAPRLTKLVRSSPVVREAQATGSNRGLLVDSYHLGIEFGPDRVGMMMPFAGISQMFNRIASLLGSGGATVLFAEGSGFGASSGRYLNSLLGPGQLDWKVEALVGVYRTIGWGNASVHVEKTNSRYRVKFLDCFECSDAAGVRNECSFLRGHLTEALGTLSGSEFKVREKKCRLKGDSYCEFGMTKA